MSDNAPYIALAVIIGVFVLGLVIYYTLIKKKSSFSSYSSSSQFPPDPTSEYNRWDYDISQSYQTDKMPRVNTGGVWAGPKYTWEEFEKQHNLEQPRLRIREPFDYEQLRSKTSKKLSKSEKTQQRLREIEERKRQRELAEKIRQNAINKKLELEQQRRSQQEIERRKREESSQELNRQFRERQEMARFQTSKAAFHAPK